MEWIFGCEVCEVCVLFVEVCVIFSEEYRGEGKEEKPTLLALLAEVAALNVDHAAKVHLQAAQVSPSKTHVSYPASPSVHTPRVCRPLGRSPPGWLAPSPAPSMDRVEGTRPGHTQSQSQTDCPCPETHLARRVVLDDDLQRLEDRHAPRRLTNTPHEVSKA